MDSIIFQRIKELCEEKGISVTKLESAVGMSQYSIAKWRGAVSPSTDKILKVAKYFGVSLDYLVGSSDIRTPADELAGDSDIISIQRAREKMSDQEKRDLMDVVRISFREKFQDEP